MHSSVERKADLRGMALGGWRSWDCAWGKVLGGGRSWGGAHGMPLMECRSWDGVQGMLILSNSTSCMGGCQSSAEEESELNSLKREGGCSR